MSEAIYDWMSPQERMARYRRTTGNVERRVRPCNVIWELTDDEQAELDTLGWHARLTRYREMVAARQSS